MLFEILVQCHDRMQLCLHVHFMVTCWKLKCQISDGCFSLYWFTKISFCSNLIYYIYLVFMQDELRDAVLLVFANKQDLPNAMNAAEITDKLGLHSLRHRHWYDS